MPISRTIGQYHDASNARIRKIGEISGPAVYVVGGELITAAMLGLGRLEAFLPGSSTNAAHTTFYHLIYDAATQRVVWCDCGTGNEAIAGADLSGYTARFEAIGI